MAKKKAKNNSINEVSPIMMIAIFTIFVVAMIFVTYFGMNLQYPASKYFSQYDLKVENELGKVLRKQKEMDDKIVSLSQDGGYTFDDPLIIKSPYIINKLTALIIFNTDEETKVEVQINDVHKTFVEKSKNHIIPIYGLYAGKNNIVTLTLDDGKSKEHEIVFEGFNDNISGFDVDEVLNSEDIYYLVGNMNDDSIYLRGFDSRNNLIAYYDLATIKGLTIYKNKISLLYNPNKEVTNDLRLDMDYLGRIMYVSSDTLDVNMKTNITNNKEVSFIGAPGYLYDAMISNYTTKDVQINELYSPKTDLAIKDYDGKLSNAAKYEGEFKVSFMGDYIAFDSEFEGDLIIVSINGDMESHKINNTGIIRTKLKGNKALYVEKGGVVYNLNTTLLDIE